jgi:hypothetical protein
MPLEKSASKAAFRHNVKAEVSAGKPQKQAVAIAYSERRAAGGKDELRKAVAAGAKEAEHQRKAEALMSGRHVSGRDRKR